MTNCSILGSAMDLAWIPTQRVVSFIEEHVGASMARLLSEAHRRGVPVREEAVSYAEQRFERMCQDAERTTMLDRLVELEVAVNRRDLLPGAVVAAASMPYFKRMVSQHC